MARRGTKARTAFVGDALEGAWSREAAVGFRVLLLEQHARIRQRLTAVVDHGQRVGLALQVQLAEVVPSSWRGLGQVEPAVPVRVGPVDMTLRRLHESILGGPCAFRQPTACDAVSLAFGFGTDGLGLP